MRRSTRVTRAFGGAALVLALAGAVLPILRYEPAPRYGVMAALGGALVCGFGWALATFAAPEAEGTASGAVPRAAGALPPIPARPPRRGLSARLHGAVAMACVVSFAGLFMLAIQPDGAQARTIRAVVAHGPSVANGTITAVGRYTDTGASKGGPKGQRGTIYYHTVLRVKVPGGQVDVTGGIVEGEPHVGRHVHVLYAPKRLDLGGYVDASVDVGAFATGTPGLGTVQLAVIVLFIPIATVLVLGMPWTVGRWSTLAWDAKAGRVWAVPVSGLAPRWSEGRATLSGQRPNGASFDVEAAPWEAVAMAAAFEDVPGRLCMPLPERGGRLTEGGRLPALFVADDGRTAWCAVPRKSAALGGPVATTPGATLARPLPPSCLLPPRERLLLVAAMTVVGLGMLPLLNGSATHAEAWWTFVLAFPALIYCVNRANGRAKNRCAP